VVPPAAARPSALSHAPAASSAAPSQAAAGRRAGPGTSIVVLVLVALVALALPGATPAALASGDAEASFVAAVNRERGAAGLPALQVAGDLVAVARQHAGRMAGSDHLHHNAGLGGAVGGWEKIGENVGHGADVGDLHAAFVASPSHRANVLDPEWTQVGVGVAVDGHGDLWVTQVFRLPVGATDPPAPGAAASSTPEPDPTAEPTREAPDRDAPKREAEPAPEPDGPVEHEVVEVPPTVDRIAVVLARIDADDRPVPDPTSHRRR
jgi:uncharacterized protein YkwD